jgi:hypothetical protein
MLWPVSISRHDSQIAQSMIDQAQLAAADQFHETSQVDQENIIRLANRLVGQEHTLPPPVNKALII